MSSNLVTVGVNFWIVVHCEWSCRIVNVLSNLQTCLRESDDSDIEESLSIHSDDQRSEASWEPVDRKETEVAEHGPSL